MVRTKLVLKKRVRIRQWPPREPYVQFNIKTLLPEQKVVQIKKRRGDKNSNCKNKNKEVYRSVGKKLLKC